MDATWVDRWFGSRAAARARGSMLVETPTALVRVRHEGNGRDTVVFVCDTPVFIEHYARLFELLSPTLRVVCIELPGMGFSVPAGAYRYSLLEQAQAVVGVLDALKLQGCTLALTCVGGYLAPLIAERRPELVRRVLLIQVPSWDQERQWARRIDFRGLGVVATPYVGQLVMRAFEKQVARRWFYKALAPGRSKPFVDVAIEALDDGASWALASLVQSYFGEPPPDLRPLRVPTLSLWGELDRTHRGTDKRSVLTLAPDAQIVSFASAGHCPDLEEPDRFRDLLCEFVARS